MNSDEKEDIKDGEEYYARHLQFQYQSQRRRKYRAKPSIHRYGSDADNDRDIRPREFQCDADNDRDIRPKTYHGDYQSQTIYQSRARNYQNSYQRNQMAANHNAGNVHRSHGVPYSYSDAVKSSRYENKMSPRVYNEYHVPTKNRFSGLEDNYQGNY